MRKDQSSHSSVIIGVRGWVWAKLERTVAARLQPCAQGRRQGLSWPSSPTLLPNTDDQACGRQHHKEAQLSLSSFCPQGDSGGPLVCNNTVQGIFSYGKMNKEPPGVFMKVSHFLTWIKRTMKRH